MNDAITRARALQFLKCYRHEIELLTKAASVNVHDHHPLVTDTELLKATKRFLQELEESATEHPGIQELRLYVRKAIGAENHSRYIAAMLCAVLSAEHYIFELDQSWK